MYYEKFMRRIETGSTHSGILMLKKIADALELALEDLVEFNNEFIG